MRTALHLQWTLLICGFSTCGLHPCRCWAHVQKASRTSQVWQAPGLPLPQKASWMLLRGTFGLLLWPSHGFNYQLNLVFMKGLGMNALRVDTMGREAYLDPPTDLYCSSFSSSTTWIRKQPWRRKVGYVLCVSVMVLYWLRLHTFSSPPFSSFSNPSSEMRGDRYITR